MNYIATTKTQLEKLKMRARELKATEGLMLSAAKEKAAREAGYDNWHHVVSCQKLRSTPPMPDLAPAEILVSILPIKGGAQGNYFYHIEIEGQRFQGAINEEGPYIQHHGTSTVHLGVAGIWQTKKGRSEHEAPGWFICKYGPSQPRISLKDLSPAGRLALATEFGIPIYETPGTVQNGGVDAEMEFYLSPAFRELCEWAEKRPRKIRSFAPGVYMPDWVERAADGWERFVAEWQMTLAVVRGITSRG